MSFVSEQHEFALYASAIIDQISTVKIAADIVITDIDLLHRIQRVLRLRCGATLIVFGDVSVFRGTITEISPVLCRISPISIRPIVPVAPPIQLGIAILERPAFAAVVEYATVLGVSVIQPLITAKSKRHVIDRAERERLARIMIAAAEQSKQFCIPRIATEILLRNYIPQQRLVVCDAAGVVLTASYFTSYRAAAGIALLIGPEGGLTSTDVSHIQVPYETVNIASTILRAELAVSVGLGIFRALMR